MWISVAITSIFFSGTLMPFYFTRSNSGWGAKVVHSTLTLFRIQDHIKYIYDLVFLKNIY